MRKVLVEKLVAALLTGYLVATLHWTKVVLLYIVLGQGHFLIAYLYQFKAGKMNRGYLTVAAGSLLLITGVYLRWPHYRALVAVTTIYFLVHMLLDELYLMRFPMNLRESPMNFARALEMTPVFLLYSARVVEALFSRFRWGSTTLGDLALYLSWASLAAYLILLLRGRHRPDGQSAYFLSWSALLLWAVHSGWLVRIPTGKLTGFIIIYHYLAWYLHYFLNLPPGPKRSTYSFRVLGINALVLTCFGVWGQKGPGRYFFQNDYFYIWTLLHLITSTRLSDIKGLFRPPTVSPPSG